MIWDQQVTVIF